MYDTDKARELQKQSHVRGALSKQFYSNQQQQLQQKRRQMKRILDEQVEQRKRVKQRQKLILQNRQRKQQEQIKKYYQNVGQRQRRVSQQSSGYQNSNKIINQSPFKGQNDSLVKKHVQQTMKHRVSSKTQIHDYDTVNYSLMPLLSLSEGQLNHNRGVNIQQHEFSINSDRLNQLTYRHFDQHAGNIPLLDLSDQNTLTKTKKKTKLQIKKQPTERSQRENNHVNNSVMRNSIAKLDISKSNQNKNGQNNNNTNQSPQNTNTNHVLITQSNQSITQSIKKRRRTISNQQTPMALVLQQATMLNSRLSKGSKVNDTIVNNNNKSPVQTKGNIDMMDIPQEIEKIQTQNRQLKSELKKNQEAISLLIGAVRSNPKLDKFRVQAEKILHNQHTQTYPKTSYQPEKKFTEKKEESTLLLPKIKIKHQSIMHDYLLEAAKKARVKQIKSQTHNY